MKYVKNSNLPLIIGAIVILVIGLVIGLNINKKEVYTRIDMVASTGSNNNNNSSNSNNNTTTATKSGNAYLKSLQVNYEGLTPNYIRVVVKSDKDIHGEILKVKLTDIRDEYVEGILI